MPKRAARCARPDRVVPWIVSIAQPLRAGLGRVVTPDGLRNVWFVGDEADCAVIGGHDPSQARSKRLRNAHNPWDHAIGSRTTGGALRHTVWACEFSSPVGPDTSARTPSSSSLPRVTMF